MDQKIQSLFSQKKKSEAAEGSAKQLETHSAPKPTGISFQPIKPSMLNPNNPFLLGAQTTTKSSSLGRPQPTIPDPGRSTQSQSKTSSQKVVNSPVRPSSSDSSEEEELEDGSDKEESEDPEVISRFKMARAAAKVICKDNKWHC